MCRVISLRTRRAGLLACHLVVAVLLAGCGSPPPSEAAGGGPEKSSLVVGALPVPDSAALYVAIKLGLFARVGLKVKAETIQAGPDAAPRLINKSLDIALNNYVSAILAERNGVHWKFIADAYDGQERGFLVLAGKNSSIQQPKDLVGKKIAVPAIPAIGTLAITKTLITNAVSPEAAKQVQFVKVPFPSMQTALDEGKVDAIWATEPWITKASAEIGARTVMDTMKDATAGLPIAGWMITPTFARTHPKTVKAFQQAIGQAQQLLSGDRSVVQNILPTYTKIDRATASLIGLGEYPTTFKAIRVQRVADLMQEFGYLNQRLDVSTMLVGAT